MVSESIGMKKNTAANFGILANLVDVFLNRETFLELFLSLMKFNSFILHNI